MQLQEKKDQILGKGIFIHEITCPRKLQMGIRSEYFAESMSLLVDFGTVIDGIFANMKFFISNLWWVQPQYST